MPRYNPNTGQLETYQPGPFDATHLYLQWGGKLPGGEEWSCGIRLANTGSAPTGMSSGMLTSYTTAVQAFHVATNTGISSHAKLSFVKCHPINTDGHYLDENSWISVLADVAGGIAMTDPVYPNQVAWAVTLTTGFSRGPAHKGRFYVPLPTCPTRAAGLTDVTYATNLSGTVDTLVAALNAVNADYDVAVFSRKAGAPAHRLVTGNLVGRVLDTQRRRRRKIGEDYR